MNRTRVLWLSHLLPWPPKGGLQQRSYYLMRAVGRRHDLRVVAFSQRAHQADPDCVRAAIAALSDFCIVQDAFPLPSDKHSHGKQLLAVQSLLPGPPYTIRWGHDVQYGSAVRSAIKTFHPDVIHVDTVSLANYVGQHPEAPAVLNHHNIESHMLARRAEREQNVLRMAYFWQEARRLARYERRVADRFSAHLVCSELDRQRLLEIVDGANVAIVPNGVDLEYFRPADLDRVEQHSLVFVGGLSWYPNLEAMRFFLREVWPKIKNRYPATDLRIIGRDAPPDLKALAANDGRVHFLGFVDDIRPIVHKSAVYVCPIRDGGGTKLKMLDAMAMGKAIVAHPIACEGLQVVDRCQVLLAESGQSIADRVFELFESDALRSTLSRNARLHVERYFSFEMIGNDLADTIALLGTQCARR